MIAYPPLSDVELHGSAAAAALRAAGVSGEIVSAIRTKALKTARKTTGPHATNRKSRWEEPTTHPQYGTEYDCKIIFVKLVAQTFCFDNAPPLPTSLSRVPENVKALGPLLKDIFEQDYLGKPIVPGSYRDSLLLECFDFNDLIAEGLNPKHGHSSFHLGHEDPTRKPKHTPDNTAWRTMRSNLIQGDMTLRESRIYFVKLIGRYFDLGEIEIEGEASPDVVAATPTLEDAGE
jgi:hypothetical protein